MNSEMCRIGDERMSNFNWTANVDTEELESWIKVVPYFLEVTQAASDDLYKLLMWLWVYCLLQVYLFYRELCMYNSAKCPELLKKYWTESEFDETRQNGIRQMRSGLFKLICIFARITTFTILLLTGCIRNFWGLSDKINIAVMNWVLYDDCYRDMCQIFIFAFVVTIVYQVISGSFQDFSAFSMETTDDFFDALQSWKYYTQACTTLFVVSFSVSILATATILAILSMMNRLVTGPTQVDGDGIGWFLFWIQALYPLVVSVMLEMVLFLKQFCSDFGGFTKQLPLGRLANKVKLLAAAVNFPPGRIVLTSAGYSYCEGPTTRERIHLDEFFFKPLDPPENAAQTGTKTKSRDMECLATLAHELGHWVHRDGTIRYALEIQFAIIVAFMTMGLTVHLENQLYVAAVGIFIVTGNLTIMRIWRDQEYEADKFAAKLGLGKHLVSRLTKGCLKHSIFPLSDSLFSAWYGTHPTLLERITAIKEFNASINTTGSR